MNIVIAADKFKGSCNSFQVCNAITRGFLQASSQFKITTLPLSDGGDGFADVMAHYTTASKIPVTVCDPLLRPVSASYLLSKDGRTAIIEMAQASGLLLLKPEEYNPLQTSTFGTGQLIEAARQHGVSKIILGIGGSATNDCGIGMAAALGYRFYDASGMELKPVGANLIHIEHIDASSAVPMNDVVIEIASDVTNHLTGSGGAAKTYATQKGATPEMVELLEEGAVHFASVVQRDKKIDLNTINGGGAAGGIGAGGVLFLNATLRSGVELVLNYSDAEAQVKNTDIVITGEGKLDAQSLQGKVVHGVAALGVKYNKPVIALCGSLDVDLNVLNEAGISAAFSILNKPMSLADAMQHAESLLNVAAYNLGNFFKSPYQKIGKLKID